MKMITAIACALMTALMLCQCPPATALMLSKGLIHYARDMEFYYEQPRPENLRQLLRGFERAGVLGQAEKRMMIAAFLGEAMSGNEGAALSLRASGQQLGQQARQTLAWAVRLGNPPRAAEWLEALLAGASEILRGQIMGCPASLAAWDITRETSVLQMYWGAFMASGRREWVAEIVRAACEYARLNASGRQRDPSFAVCRAAAASLYEMAPRHAAVRACVADVLRSASGPEARTLTVILQQNGAP